MKSMTKAFILISLISNYMSAYAADGPPPSPVKVESVSELVSQPQAEMLGTVYSRNQIPVTAGVAGRLEWVAEPGTFVVKGDKVAQIELLPLQLRQAERKAQLKRAKINLQYLSRELERQKALRKKNSASQYQLEQTESQFELAQSDLEIAQLQLKQINEELNRATILSPFDGVVTDRNRRAGVDVNRGETLVQLLDTENLEVRAFVPVKYLSYTKPGSQLTLASKSQSGEILTVSAFASVIIPAADPKSQTFEIRISMPQKGREFWASGQILKVYLPIESTRHTVTIHRDALILRRDGTYVFRIDPDNTAHKLKVKVGRGNGDRVTVEGDLKSGDKVAIRGAERLSDGQKVTITDA
ncbi:efflux RND transporter periplasmic adaptor subunit [Aliikangiella sp. G2MR2-5]|uniref:efflux RND transporter periplasmic adaptor subunit n=1 Tax=Aliikangiella sp. G2MR2-5 TaxID=2788943 RepID=UPI0018AB37A8|nr:efflux RND transporter periplasmic adaptor subunit [Aliikangiella sp. G2MR2-5]